MRLGKANFAGLTSSLQQAEMKSILAGAWPPLKPLPVFRYETPEYRATIDFDKKRGEWVCRKICFPSNTIQELRGGLREITMELPHDEAQIFTEDPEHQEQELEKDVNRRLRAMHEWREQYESGALYFQLRDQLSEGQRTEIDDTLRLSLTARQLQFNPKNAAYVFDNLATAGGRFATLIEFAKQRKARQTTELQPQREATTHEPERSIEHDEPSLEENSRDSEPIVENPMLQEQKASDRCMDVEEPPAVSIKNVLPEPEQAPLAERKGPHEASQSFEMETAGILDGDSRLHAELDEGQPLSAFTDLVSQVPIGAASADQRGNSSSHLPALEISVFQVAVFSALFLSAVFAFTVGLTVGRGPLASRFREAPKSILAMDAKSPTVAEPAGESIPRISAATSANAPGSTSRPGEAALPERKSEENTRIAEYSTKVGTTDTDSPGSREFAKREVSPELTGTMETGSTAARRLTPTMSGSLSQPRSTAILVTRPGRGSQPFRVSFPEKTIAATPSLAMSSQLSVLVSAEPGFRTAHKSARLEAGNLVSFVWPRYTRPGNRNELGETIRVRATIGQLGQVREVKFVSGANSLLPAAKAAIRQWRYRPTLLDKKPVQAQQDVTIEFRPARYSPRVSTRNPSHN